MARPSPTYGLTISIFRNIVAVFSHSAFVVVITFEAVVGASIAGIVTTPQIIAFVAHGAFCNVDLIAS